MSLADASWIIMGLPLTGVVFGLLGYFWLRHESRQLDRKYGKRSGE